MAKYSNEFFPLFPKLFLGIFAFAFSLFSPPLSLLPMGLPTLKRIGPTPRHHGHRYFRFSSSSDLSCSSFPMWRQGSSPPHSSSPFVPSSEFGNQIPISNNFSSFPSPLLPCRLLPFISRFLFPLLRFLGARRRSPQLRRVGSTPVGYSLGVGGCSVESGEERLAYTFIV